MAFYDVIRFEGVSSDWILYKHPVDEFNNGSRLIVSIGQVAIIAHNGVIEKILIDGSYKINSELLPILKSFTKKFFGGHNPYPIEIYFINKRLKLDFLWGTSEPIKMFDPIYHIEINIRARGQLGIRISDYQFFLQTLIGSLLKDNYITFDVLKNYFKGIINEKVKQEITRFMLSKKVSIFEITAHLDEIKSNFFKILKEEFYKYGFDLVNLSIESIAVSSIDEFIKADKISKLELFNEVIFKSPIDAVAKDIALLYANSNFSASLLFLAIELLNST